MSREALKPLSGEHQQAFDVLRTDTRQFNGRTISQQEFDTMRTLVDTYKQSFNVPNPPPRLGNQLLKKGWFTNAQGEKRLWILQYDDEGRYMALVDIPIPKEEVIVAHQAHSVATSVHQALQPGQTSFRQAPLVSAEMKVPEGESLKFFGANGRAQRLMADDLLAKRDLTIEKLLSYAKASAEPDIAIKFLEKYFDYIEAVDLPEIPADQWKLLEEFAIRMNGTKTLIPDFCADKLSRFHLKKPIAQILTDLQTHYSRGSQPLMRLTLLSALGQRMKRGEQVSTAEIKTIWRLGKEEVFMLLKYLPKEQRDEIMQ